MFPIDIREGIPNRIRGGVEIDVGNDVSNLFQRGADIAPRLFRPMQNDLVVRKTKGLTMGLFAHESYPAAKTLDDLRQHVLKEQDRNPSVIGAYRVLATNYHQPIFQRCDNDVVEINAVRADIGIAPLHIGMAKELARGRSGAQTADTHVRALARLSRGPPPQ